MVPIFGMLYVERVKDQGMYHISKEPTCWHILSCGEALLLGVLTKAYQFPDMGLG